MTLRTLNEMLLNSRDKFRDRAAFKVKNGAKFEEISFGEFYHKVEQFGTGLLELGFKKGDHIGLISENRLEWIISDLAIIGIGAVDVPTSGNSFASDIAFKLNHSNSIATILEGEKVFLEFLKVFSEIPNIKHIILLEPIKVFSEPDEAQGWITAVPFRANEKISKSFYDRICSTFSDSFIPLLISEKAKLFLEKYLSEHGKELSDSINLTGVAELEKRLWQKVYIVSNGNIDNLPPIFSFSQITDIGKKCLEKGDKHFANIALEALPDDLVTIIYTSGTTSDPKGVMLTHRNFMHNVNNVPISVGDLNERDRFLSVLPSWHIYERTVEYCAIGIGASTAYSKPFKQILLPDLLLEKPTVMCTVPRIWQSLHKGVLDKVKNGGKLQRLLFFKSLYIAKRYKHAKRILDGTWPLFERAQFSEQEMKNAKKTVNSLSLLYKISNKLIFKKIRDMLGGEIKFAISGGGALPEDIDIFFDALDILVLEGYGLTETSPVVAGRKQCNPVIFTVGEPIIETEIKVVNKENLDIDVPNGKPGVVMIKGDLVMKGYFKNEERTAEVMKGGWFNTGDLGKKTYNGKYLKIIGRIKDTIVLAGGENVEPQPLEDKLKESPYINMAIVVGQDKSRLGALIVPDFETLKEFAQEKHLNYQNYKDLIKNREILSLFQQEQKRLISRENGFQSFEAVMGIALLADEFSLEKGEMTESLKLKRFIIHEKYKEEIDRICK
jgi:long-chain acyl-CoA synthetase